MTTVVPQSPDPERLTLREAERLSGVSASTWGRWCRAGAVPARRIGVRVWTVSAQTVADVIEGTLVPDLRNPQVAANAS
jgi:hypothetical protein